MAGTVVLRIGGFLVESIAFKKASVSSLDSTVV